MNLRQFLEAKGYVRPGYNKCVCPFHGDRNPSAIMNHNSIYCFTESRLYGLWDFQQAFGIILDKVQEEESVFLNSVKGRQAYSYNQALFYFPFKVKEG